MCAEYAHIDQASTRCKGTIYNCDYVDDDLTVCPVIIIEFPIDEFKVNFITQAKVKHMLIFLFFFFFQYVYKFLVTTKVGHPTI